MPCALEVIDTRVQSTSHIQCNRSFDRNIASHFSKGHLIHKPVSVRPENGNTALSILPLGHDSDWKPAPILSDFQEVNKVISLTSADQGIEGLELLSAQPRIPCCSGQPNERNMHDQADPSKPVSNGNPYGRSTSSQSRQRKSICNLSIAVPPCHVVAKKFSWPATTTMRSGSDILHDGDKPLKKSSRKKGNRKGKEYGRMTRKKLNLSSEITFEENTSGVSPVEVLPPNLLVDKLSEITPCASSVVKEAHLGGEKNNDYVSCGTLLNLSTLGTDEMDGSECAGSSNDAAGGRLSCSCVPYLNDESNTTDSSEFDGSTFTEHGMGEESKSYQMLPCACVYNPDCATTDSFLSKWNNGNSGNYRVNVEARLTMKDENSHDHSQLAATTGLNDARKCQLIGSQLSATHAEDTNDHLEGRSSSSKDVTDSCNHTERVQCSSEACSSNPSLQISSGRSRRSRKTPSYSDLTASNRVMSANRHKNNGKDSLAVWQKVERNDKIISKTGHSSNPSIQDKSAHENSNKGVHEDPTRNRAKHKLNRKVCKQESPNETVELATKEEDALDSCQTFSRPIYKNQTPLLRQQRSSSSKQGSQPSKYYYAPRNSIPKVPKDSLQQEELSTLQHDTNTSDKSASNSCSADEFVLTGGGSNHPTKGNERSQSVIDIASLTSCNLASDLMLQAASEDAHISDPHCLCPEDKGVYTSWSSKSLCTDPCTAETEEARCVKLTTENNSQESCKWYSATGHLSQKWVPVGKKDASNVIHLGVSEASVVEDTDTPANGITDSVGPVSTNGEDRKLASEMTSKLNSAEHDDLKCQSYNGIATDYTKIKEAISYVHTAQQQTEDIQLLIGRPLADFEQFVYSASPVVHCKPCPAGCKSYLQECARNGLCFHQTPDITLRSVWQWYEEPGCYGLEVKAQDFRRSKGLWKSHCQFTKYFIPYLSAVQLFRQTKRTSGGSSVKETTDRDMTCETSQCQNVPPIFAKLMPQQSNPKNRSSTLHTEDDHQSANGELIFEFFESEQPYSRRQLFDKRLTALPARVTELIAGVRTVNCQTFGDPKSLELSLHDLHPASWYCVAWYPIYSIPDGKLQAAFLTYHSLGHWISRNSSADEAVALPVIGLQSYNDKAERWFEMSKSDSEDGEPAEWQCSEASQVLKQRSRTLNEAAAVMSRANVVKNGQMSRNRHPDYEFFLSRYR